MSDTENDAPTVDAGDADEPADVIRPVTAGTTVSDAPDDAAEADGGDGDGAQADPEGDCPGAAGDDGAAGGDAGGADGDTEAAAADVDKPVGEAQPDAEAEADSKPPSAGQDVSEPIEQAPAGGNGGEEAGGDEAAAGTDKAEDEAAGGEALPAEGEADEERPGTSHSHHPDVITDISQSPEAHAELDEMAQQQAREVIQSRQSSASGERAKLSSSGAGAEEAKRRSSTSNASVRSATTPPAKPVPAEPIAKMAMQPPSPSKIKSGPWLTGTYKLPKSGKIISGEELCEALERMTNAYIDKYTRDKDPMAKEIPPGAATVFNTKKLTQDEYDAMISRLYKPKDRNVQDTDHIQLVTLKFGDDGQEQWQPVKQVSAEEQKQYMCELYQRCLDNRKKMQEELAAKYLKPLGVPRKR